MAQSGELLRRYANDGDETAFQELVQRHLNLVYSTALRKLSGDSDRAREACQIVFTDLARKARALATELVLPGWLYRHTTFVASKLMRAERRRANRERQAMAELRRNHDTENDLWRRVRPVLDDAMQALKGNDRDVVVLRFFEGMTLRETGEVLGISEDAARMRVERALERLRQQLGKRGVTSTSSALAAALMGSAITVAPSGLASGLTGLALAGASQSSGLGIPLLKLIPMTKLKMTLASAVVAAGVATPVWIQHKANEELQAKENAINQLRAELNELREENQNLRNRRHAEEENLERRQAERLELMRLRSEVGSLRGQLEDQENQAKEDEASAANEDESTEETPAPTVSTFRSSVDAEVPLGETVVTGGWLLEPGKRGFALFTPEVHPAENGEDQIIINTSVIAVPDEALGKLGLTRIPVEVTESTLEEFVNGQELEQLIQQLVANEGGRITLAAPKISTLSGREGRLFIGNTEVIDGKEVDIGQKINVLPILSPDGSSVKLSTSIEWNRLDQAPPKEPKGSVGKDLRAVIIRKPSDQTNNRQP